MADANPTTDLTLKEDKSLTDLMAASAEVTLVDGGTNVVTLSLQRKVMLLKAVTINQVPTSATNVEVTISPLSESLTIGNEYSGENGSTTVSLTKQSDGRTWTMDDEDNWTGIELPTADSNGVDEIYNLNGQRVAAPTKGLYIRNNKKVVIK